MSTSFLYQMLFDSRAGDNDLKTPNVDEQGDPFTKFLQRTQESELHKGIAGVADSGWDEQLISEPVVKAEVDLAKRSSAPGRIRQEEVRIDGALFINGYNHEGELLFTKFAS